MVLPETFPLTVFHHAKLPTILMTTNLFLCTQEKQRITQRDVFIFADIEQILQSFSSIQFQSKKCSYYKQNSIDHLNKDENARSVPFLCSLHELLKIPIATFICLYHEHQHLFSTELFTVFSFSSE